MTAASIVAMNHSFRYRDELDGGDEEKMNEAIELGKRTAALVKGGKAKHEDFAGMPTPVVKVIVAAMEAGKYHWLGRRARGDLIAYQSPSPLKKWRGYEFTSAIGPFFSRVGSAYYARKMTHGEKCSPAEIERRARSDDDVVWVAVRESIESGLTLEATDMADFFFEYDPVIDKSPIDVTAILLRQPAEV